MAILAMREQRQGEIPRFTPGSHQAGIELD